MWIYCCRYSMGWDCSLIFHALWPNLGPRWRPIGRKWKNNDRSCTPSLWYENRVDTGSVVPCVVARYGIQMGPLGQKWEKYGNWCAVDTALNCFSMSCDRIRDPDECARSEMKKTILVVYYIRALVYHHIVMATTAVECMAHSCVWVGLLVFCEGRWFGVYPLKPLRPLCRWRVSTVVRKAVEATTCSWNCFGSYSKRLHYAASWPSH